MSPTVRPDPAIAGIAGEQRQLPDERVEQHGLLDRVMHVLISAFARRTGVTEMHEIRLSTPTRVWDVLKHCRRFSRIYGSAGVRPKARDPRHRVAVRDLQAGQDLFDEAPRRPRPDQVDVVRPAQLERRHHPVSDVNLRPGRADQRQTGHLTRAAMREGTRQTAAVGLAGEQERFGTDLGVDESSSATAMPSLDFTPLAGDVPVAGRSGDRLR